MKIFITGAAGFVARNLASQLKEKQCFIHGCDIFACPEEIEDLYDKYETVDLAEARPQQLEVALSDYDVVYHLAAIARPSMYVSNPLTTIKSNLHAGMKVFDAAISNGCKIIFTSTSEVYGIGILGSMAEDSIRSIDTPGTLRWVYSNSKAMLEDILFANKKEGGFDDFVTFRLFNAVGQGIDKVGSGRVFTSMIDRMLNDKKIIVTRPGIQTRCFCHISDIVEWLTYPVISEDSWNRMKGDVYNVGNPSNIATMSGLAEMIIGSMGVLQEYDHVLRARWPDWHVKVEYKDAEEFHGKGYSEVMNRVPVIDKVVGVTNIMPHIPLQVIVREMVKQAMLDAIEEDAKFAHSELQKPTQ